MWVFINVGSRKRIQKSLMQLFWELLIDSSPNKCLKWCSEHLSHGSKRVTNRAQKISSSCSLTRVSYAACNLRKIEMPNVIESVTSCISRNFKLPLTLQVRRSSSSTAADWSDAAGPSPEATAGREAAVSWTAWAERSVLASEPRLSGKHTF